MNNLDSRCEISYTPTLISCLHLVRPISWTDIHLCGGDGRGPPPLALINKTLFMPLQPLVDCRITRREIKWLSGPVPAVESERSSLFTSAVTWREEWCALPQVTPPESETGAWRQHRHETLKCRTSSCCWADARERRVISPADRRDARNHVRPCVGRTPQHETRPGHFVQSQSLLGTRVSVSRYCVCALARLRCHSGLDDAALVCKESRPTWHK